MGRGNACTRGDYEGLYYIDYDNFIYDFECSESLGTFTHDFLEKYKSFTPCDVRIDSDTDAILESELFYIAIEDNEWSIAIKLIQKEEPYYWNGSIEGLQKKHYQTYLNGMKECLFNQFDTLGVYGGPWTSGTISKEVNA